MSIKMATLTSCKRKIAALCVAIVGLLEDIPKPDVSTTALLGNTFHEQHWELELMFPGWQDSLLCQGWQRINIEEEICKVLSCVYN